MFRLGKFILNQTFIMLITILVSSGIAFAGGVEHSVKPVKEAIKVAIERLPPSVFTNLPEAIRRALDMLGCTVPQPCRGFSYEVNAPLNVISGEFITAGQKDWAVLCSRNGSSSILIFWNGLTDKRTELDASRDDEWQQNIGSARSCFSRQIMKASRKQIERYHDNAEALVGHEPDLPPLKHDGINQFFLDKASTIRYFNNGSWINLPGED